jgi:hypothetical protein
MHDLFVTINSVHRSVSRRGWMVQNLLLSVPYTRFSKKRRKTPGDLCPGLGRYEKKYRNTSIMRRVQGWLHLNWRSARVLSLSRFTLLWDHYWILSISFFSRNFRETNLSSSLFFLLTAGCTIRTIVDLHLRRRGFSSLDFLLMIRLVTPLGAESSGY